MNEQRLLQILHSLQDAEEARASRAPFDRLLTDIVISQKSRALVRSSWQFTYARGLATSMLVLIIVVMAHTYVYTGARTPPAMVIPSSSIATEIDDELAMGATIESDLDQEFDTEQG